ncbi:MAG: ATP-binding protein [Arcobacteraceae bacterium]
MKKKLKVSIKTIFIVLTLIALTSTILVTIALSKNSKNELIYSESKKYFEQSMRLSQTIFDYEIEKISSVINLISFGESEIRKIRENRIEEIENELNKTVPKTLDFTAIIPFKNNKEESSSSAVGGLFLYDITLLLEELKKIKSSTLKRSLIHININNKELVFIVVSKGIVDDANGEIVGIFVGGIELNHSYKFIQNLKEISKLDEISLLYNNETILSNNHNELELEFLTKFNHLTHEKNEIVGYRSNLTFDSQKSPLNLKMSLSNESFKTTRYWVYKDLTIVTLLSIVIMGFFIYYINKLLIKPIENLKIYAKNFFEKKDLEEEDLELKIIEYQELANYLKQLFIELLNNQEKLIVAKDKINSDIQIIKSLNDTLELKVQEKTKELSHLNDTLKQKVTIEVEKNRKKDKQIIQQSRYAALGEMIGNIAHQWRQPLSAISTTSSAMKLEMQVGIASNEDIVKALDNIMQYVLFLNQTIEDFRGFFRQDLTQEEFNMTDSLKNTLKIIFASYKDNNIKIVTHFNEKELFCMGSSSELSQVLINVLNNAKDVMIEKDIVDKKICIVSKSNGQFNEISILDNGGGVSDAIIEKIFDPYFTTKHKSQGTGIGLYMSKEIIEKKFSGSLCVINKEMIIDNEHFKGASFHIVIPKI